MPAKVPKGLFSRVDNPLLSTFSRSSINSTIDIECLLELYILPELHKSVPLSTKSSVERLLFMIQDACGCITHHRGYGPTYEFSSSLIE